MVTGMIAKMVSGRWAVLEGALSMVFISACTESDFHVTVKIQRGLVYIITLSRWIRETALG